jgi:hypothetical protein
MLLPVQRSMGLNEGRRDLDVIRFLSHVRVFYRIGFKQVWSIFPLGSSVDRVSN